MIKIVLSALISEIVLLLLITAELLLSKNSRFGKYIEDYILGRRGIIGSLIVSFIVLLITTIIASFIL